MEYCPLCKARLSRSVACPRCQSDLSQLQQIELQTIYFQQQALKHLQDGYELGALQAIRQVLRLQYTPFNSALHRFTLAKHIISVDKG